MATPNNFVRLARRSIDSSSRSLTTAAGRSSVRRCMLGGGAGGHADMMLECGHAPRSVRLITQTPTSSSSGYHCNINVPNKRYFSGEKDDSDDGNIIDRSKFTNKVEVEMPNVGDDEDGLGVIQKWYKKEGDVVKRDEVICDIRTELFTFGMLTDDDYDSIMGEILIPEESEPVKPGTVICTTLNAQTGEKE